MGRPPPGDLRSREELPPIRADVAGDAIVRHAEHLTLCICQLVAGQELIPWRQPATELVGAVVRAGGHVQHVVVLLDDDRAALGVEAAGGEQEIELIHDRVGGGGVGGQEGEVALISRRPFRGVGVSVAVVVGAEAGPTGGEAVKDEGGHAVKEPDHKGERLQLALGGDEARGLHAPLW